MCEQLAGLTGDDPDGAFTVGLFSAADALLDMPMADVLERLPFAEATAAALAHRAGPLGALLQVVLSYEDGQLEPGSTGLAVAECELAYLDALVVERRGRAPARPRRRA